MAKRKRSNLLIYLLAAVILGLVGFMYWRNQNKPKGEKVTVETVEKRTITEKVGASGRVFPQTEVKISSDVSGEIVELYVEEGDSVVVGKLLAKIDPDTYQSQVERGVAAVNTAKAQLANSRSGVEQFIAQKAQIEAQLINAKETHTRNEGLFKDGVISEADFQTSQSNLRALEANFKAADANINASKESVKASEFQVQSAEASLKELKTSLRRTTIYAPVSGVISQLNVEKGERVVGTIQMTGTEMMRIANLNAMEVQVEVSESDIPRVSIGDEVAIEIDAYIDRIFKGQVVQIANSASNATSALASLTSDQVTNFIVTINILTSSYKDLITPQKPYPFRPGMSASVEINTATVKDVIAVPIQSVTTREEDKNNKKEKSSETTINEIVFVVNTDTASMVKVKTGIQDDNYIQILEGLSENTQVITGPYTAISRKLKEGEKVLIVEEDELYAKKD